jgi:magnesium transporter
MIRSFAFTTQGRLHSKDLDTFLMPTLLADTNLFLWVDLEKPSDEERRVFLENVFHFHPLSIEDCVRANSSPKVEEYQPRDEDQFSPYLFMVIHAVDYSRQVGTFATTELNFFLGRNFLVTYHEQPFKSVEKVEEVAQRGTTNIGRAPDRVAHMILDGIVENYKPALDELAVEIGDLETAVMQESDKHILDQLLKIKKEVAYLRQIIAPQREVLARFARGEFKLIRARMVPYYRDVYDALFRISELAHNYSDSVNGVLQVYLNLSSNQTGEVVKLLTMITLITTPVTLVGSWYGMNFPEMPELHWKYGYEISIILTVVSTWLTYWYFKKKKWF